MKIGEISIGENLPFVLIAGPCVIEESIRDTWGPTWETASALKELTDCLDIPFVFKASFDKANRSHATSFRGPGLQDGLDILRRIKETFGLLITTDVHEVWQVTHVASVVDLIQIPALLCRQTDLLLAAGESGCPVNIKKGQFLAPTEMSGVVSKLDTVDATYMLTERGMTFGPNNLIVDMRSLQVMKSFAPVVFDATHSVQLPGTGIASGGQRQFAFPLARAAVAVGVHGLFFEIHPAPSLAKCDGSNMLALKECKTILRHLVELDQCVREHSWKR